MTQRGLSSVAIAAVASSQTTVLQRLFRSAHWNIDLAIILFVDDDPLIAMSTTEMLEDHGYRVIGASSALHALNILKSEQPIDLMVTDHVMPGMTGIELAAVSREVRPSLPVLLATSYAELPKGTQVDLPRLAKPYHHDQLRDRLDQLLRVPATRLSHSGRSRARYSTCLSNYR